MPVVPDDNQAWRAGLGTQERNRRLSVAHERFLSTGRALTAVRPLVAESWQRCVRSGLDPQRVIAPVELTDSDLDDWREAHPLAPVMPVVRRLLADHATEAGLVVAVGDATGRLLWVEGLPHILRRAERIHFLEGACWSESRAGTNAPGTALALNRPVQIFGSEHLSPSVTSWSCSAAPIHDPYSGAAIGVLDLTGGDEVNAPHSLALIRATVAAVESELRIRRMLGMDTAPAQPARILLRTLGISSGILEGLLGPIKLGMRHSELLALLGANPDGVIGDRLGTMLSEDDLAPVTLRAELFRLRAIMAPIPVHSRPYRLGSNFSTDADEVRSLLLRGHVAAAVDTYRGPMLPMSQAPGVVELRETLHARMRSAVIAERDPSLLLRFADTEFGRADWTLWQAAERSLPQGVALEQVRAHLQYLDRQLGSRDPAATLLQRRPT